MTILSLVCRAALAGPTLAAPSLLPGDDIIGAAAGDQFAPSLVEGPDGQWLVTWTDTRAWVAGTLGGAQSTDVSDVWGIRIDTDGVPIDPVSFPIASGPWAEATPRAAFGDGAWLVAFNADAPTQFYFGQGVYAARVGADGALLDPTAFKLEDEENDTEATWDVASDGTDWAVLVQAVDGPTFVLDGALVAGDGSVTQTRVYTPSFNTFAPWNARLAWSVDRYLAVWEAIGGSTWDIQGLYADHDLLALGAPFTIAGGGETEVKAAIAAHDDGYYVTWKDDTFGGVWVEVEGTPVDLAGGIAVPGGEVLSDTVFPADAHPDVAWDGTNWVSVWESFDSVWFTDVDGTGAVTDMNEAYPDGLNPVVAERPDGVLAAWTEYPVIDGWSFGGDVMGAAIEGDGALGDSIPIAVSTPAEIAPKIAGDASGWLVVTQSLSADDSRILAWRLDPLGTPIDAAPIEIAAGTGAIQDPAVAWNGSVYLVVWEELDPVIKQSEIHGVRVDTNGAVLDTVPLDIVPGNDPAVAASGNNFLVVSTHEPIDHFREVLGVRVDGNGTVIDTTPLDVGSSYARDPDVTGIPDGWTVAWEHYATHDNPLSTIQASVVQSSGTVGNVMTVALNGGSHQLDPSVANDGKNTLFVWSGEGDVLARFMAASGSLKGSDAGFVINAKPNDQFGTAVAFTGKNFQVAWTDWRRHPILEPGEGDVYSAFVTSKGAVKKGEGIEIAVDPDVPEGNVAVGGANGGAVLAWTKLHDEAPYGSFRVETAFFGNAAQPLIAGPAGDEDVTLEQVVARGSNVAGCDTTSRAGILGVLVGVLAIRRRRSPARGR